MGFNIFDGVSSFRGSGPVQLNWLYLVESIVVIILVIFYFFYTGRILAMTVSFILRTMFWKSQNAYFDIGAIHFSLLGGRIHFSDFRYISRNQSMRITEGSICWRYWLWRVRGEEDLASEARLPCRVTLSMEGAEWFLYNRTPSYDAILEQLGLSDPLATFNSTSESDPPSLEKDPPTPETLPPGLGGALPLPPNKGEKEGEGKKDATDWLREALPIEIKCRVGSIIMGNQASSTVLIAGFDKVDGSYAAVKSRSQFDVYKQVYRLKFSQPKVAFRTNPDYEGPMQKHGEEVLNRLQENPDFVLAGFLLRPSRFASFASFRNLLSKLPRLSTKRSSLPPAPKPSPKTSLKSKHWAGLARYQSTFEGHNAAHHEEYAKVTTLLTSPELEMTYYADTVGKVPKVPKVTTGFQGLEAFDVGNGDLSPEWGVDVVLKGGVITYGPWADRQRSELQQIFTPTTFFNNKETPKLKPGDDRVHTALKIFVEFSEGATLRIPSRETSKDWKYDDLETSSLHDSALRPYGWLDVSIGSNSTLSYVMPMVASAAGYDSLFELHLDELSVSSSVNYATFLTAQTCRVHCGLPSPLIWDELRTWTINVSLSKPDISLLRDHITLFSDVAKDWVSGPPGDYEHFVPYIYVFNLGMSDYNLRLFVNDHNIINNPATIVDNTLLVCSGPRLDTAATIPSDKYRMECSNVGFTVTTANLALAMSLPDWNTHSSFLTERTRTFATTPELNVVGNYRFFSEAHPDHVERLELAVDCRDVVFKAIGWMIRHMFNLRDNYFGTFTHFVTLEEYRHRHEQDIQGDPLEKSYRPGKTDVFEVVVSLSLRNGLMLLPQELYDCRQAVAFAIPFMEVELRNHDYFMELALNLEPFHVLESKDAVALAKKDVPSIIADEPDSVRIQGIEVTANRLFGPQPRTATYICIWSFYLGALVGSVPPSFLQAFSRVGAAIAHNFSDVDNSLPPDFNVPLDPDATFLTVDLKSIDFAIRGQSTAVQVSLPEGLAIRFDDLAEAPFLKHVVVDAPSISIGFLAPLFGKAAPWMQVASLDGDLSLVLGLSASGWKERAKTQLAFIEAQDVLTRRCAFIYGKDFEGITRIGDLYLPGLADPVRAGHALLSSFNRPLSRLARRTRSRSNSLGDEEDESESDTSSNTSDGELSSDDLGAFYAKAPDRAEAGDRFSAYGAILRLCQRAPESAFLDRPTFRRLPLAGEPQSQNVVCTDLLSTKQRLALFSEGPPTQSTDRVSISVASRRPIKIVLTPVAAQVGADVLECLAVDSDLEHGIDELYRDYLSSQNLLSPTRYDHLEVKLAIPTVQIDSIQDVLRPEHTIAISNPESNPDSTSTNGSTALCTLRLIFDAVALDLDQTKDGYGGVDNPSSTPESIIVRQKLVASAGKTRLEVFHPTQTGVTGDPLTARQPHSLPSTKSTPRNRLTALDLVIGECSITLDNSPTRALVALKGGDAQLDFVDEAAELVIGSIWSWRVLTDVAGPLARRAADRKEFMRQLVCTIARVSERSAITSFPTFLNRVSYLVGSSTNLRSDDGWKILHNLRHCLRCAHEEVEGAMADQADWPSPEALLRDVVDILARWQSWDIDAEDLTHSSLLASLYGVSKKESDLSAPSWPPVPLAVEWRAGRLAAFLSDGERSENWLSIGPVESFFAASNKPQDGRPLQAQLRVTFHDISASVDRDLLLLVRHIVNVRNTFERKIQLFAESFNPTRPFRDAEQPLPAVPAMVVDASVGFRRVSMVALADTLQAKIAATDLHLTSAVEVDPFVTHGTRPLSNQINANSTFSVGVLALIARDATVDHEELLFSTELNQVSLFVDVLAFQAASGIHGVDIDSLGAIVGSKVVSFRVPRDALRVHEFIEKFKEANLPTYDTLLTELRQGLDGIQTNPFEEPRPSRPLLDLLSPTHLRFQLAIPLISFEIQAIPTLRAGYSIRDFAAHAETLGNSDQSERLQPIEAGVHVGSQTIRFTPVADVTASLPSLPVEAAFDLPVVRLKVHLDGLPCHRLLLLATVDSVFVKLTAAVIDHILTIQNHFGNDVDKLLAVVREKRVQQAAQLPAVTPREEELPKGEPIAWDMRVALRGLKIAVEGPQATQWIEAELLEGHSSSAPSASQMMSWGASVQNLALSLAPRTAQPVTLDRRYRLAFFRLDLNISNAAINLPELPTVSIYGEHQTPHLHLRLPRVHAVIQPAAIVALGDLIEFFEAEIEERRASRQTEVEAIRERVIQLAADDNPTSLSWLASCVLSLEAQNVGVAIPLSDDEILASDFRRRSKSSQSRPAFLTTIPSLKFATQKGSAGYARMSQFAIQFVSDFDQGRKEDFDGATHKSLNRVVLPEMQITLRSPKHGPKRVYSDVSGLEIDLEPSVVAYAFSFMDVIRLSHERFAKYTPQTSDSAPSTLAKGVAVSPSASTAPPEPLTVQATFEFKSGAIRMHSKRSAHDHHSVSRSVRRPQPHRRGRSLNDFGHFNALGAGSPKPPEEVLPDLFKLPGMTINVDHVGAERDTELSQMHVDVVIHSSSNTLYPSLIPFISAISSQLKDRALLVPAAPTTTPTIGELLPLPTSGDSTPSTPPVEPVSWGQLKFGLSLRVDQSKLEISCLPAAEVTARLAWESGSFLFTVSPESRGVELAVTVDGIAAGLRHSFSPEDCLRAEAKGILGSVLFRAAAPSENNLQGLLSITVSLPEVSAEMNFRHLQDWLCLKAVWLDRMDLSPAVPQDSNVPPPAAIAIGAISPVTKTSVSTIVLIHLTKFTFACDLGQAIGKSLVVANQLDARLRWIPGESRSLTLSMRELEVSGQGRAGGSARIEGVLFSTRLRDEGGHKDMSASDLLHIQIGLGKIRASLDYEFQRILMLDADPITISVTDDWSRVVATSQTAELDLAFTVKMGSFNVIATVATIPTFASVAIKVGQLMDDKAAQADATIARAGLPVRPSRKPENAVAEVASKLASKLSTSNEDSPIKIFNRLDIELERIRVAVFEDHFNDGEVFRVDAGGGIKGKLSRGINRENKVHRDLHLFLGFFSIRRVDCNKVSTHQEVAFTVPEWYELLRTSTERNIFKVPTTEVDMESWQAVGTRHVTLNIFIDFKGSVDMALNFALLRNLSELLSTYQEQMERVKASKPQTPALALPSPLETPSSAPLSPSPSDAQTATDVAAHTIGEGTLPDDLGHDTIAMKPMPLVQAVTGDSHEWTFEALETNIHQPKLNFLGDATPPLEWLGLQRAKFPAWIHHGVTSPLEELLVVLSSTYQSSLARQKLEKS